VGELVILGARPRRVDDLEIGDARQVGLVDAEAEVGAEA